MLEPVLFQSLIPEERIEFFIKCQQILQKYHPDSPFLFTEANLTARKSYFKDFYEKYRGYCYSDENICLLFNKIKVEDPRDPVRAVKMNLWKDPTENYNAFMIDFVCFVNLADCISFCKSQYNNKIKYIVFSRANQIKIYETDKLLNKLSKLPQGFNF